MSILAHYGASFLPNQNYKSGKIFEVHWCGVENDKCVEGMEVEFPVFHDVFSKFIGDVLNDGTPLVQVRL